jgi:hypothetical protein
MGKTANAYLSSNSLSWFMHHFTILATKDECSLWNAKRCVSYLRCDPFLIQICFSENARWSYMATTHHDSNNCQATDNLSRWLHCRFLSKKVCWEYGGFEDGGHPGSGRRAADFVNFFLRDFCDRPVVESVRGPSSVRWCNSDRALESR